MTNHFSQLAQIDVKPFLEKKQNLTYLSWPHAVNALMEHDPLANWVFHEPVMYGETMMVSCTVTAFGKAMTMHLPVMDHRNQAVKNPDAFIVNKNMMRCLVKSIACHGLGLSVYAGEDLPSFPDPETGEIAPPKTAPKPIPASIEGKEGPWQLKIAANPGEIPVNEWADLALEMTQHALNSCSYADDVMKIFTTNRNVYDAVKQSAPHAYENIMTQFKAAKAKFKEAK